MDIHKLGRLVRGTSVLVIPDAHVRPDESHSDFDRFSAAGELILDLKPDHVVCIGDLGDFQSLNRWTAKSAAAFDGKAAKRDVEAYRSALRALMSPVRSANRRHQQARRKDREYRPQWHFTEGNHEEFWRRYDETHLLGHDHLQHIAEQEGWNWHRMGDPVDISGVLFAHYFSTGTSRQPVGIGQALSKTHRSCVWGHSHSFGFDMKPVLGRGTISAVCAGSFRPPHRTGPHDWSGLILLTDVRDGSFALQQLPYDAVLEQYGHGDYAQRLRAARAGDAQDLRDVEDAF